MSKVEQFWDLSSPKMARDFLKQVRFGPPDALRQIEFLQKADGGKISIDEASDEQVLQTARLLAEAMKHEN